MQATTARTSTPELAPAGLPHNNVKTIARGNYVGAGGVTTTAPKAKIRCSCATTTGTK